MAISVSAITPATGPANVSPVVITNLAGGGFVATPTVQLTKTGQTAINATSVVQVNSSQLTCNFDLTSAVTGTWNVVVTNPDTTNATLTNGFTVATLGVQGNDRASKFPKFQRTVNVGIRRSGVGVRPSSGQLYPRGH